MLSEQEIQKIICVLKSEFFKIEEYFINNSKKYIDGEILDVNFNSIGVKIIFENDKQRLKAISWEEFLRSFK